MVSLRQYKIIAKLSTTYEIAPVEVRIAASIGNWVMITSAIDPATDEIEFKDVDEFMHHC